MDFGKWIFISFHKMRAKVKCSIRALAVNSPSFKLLYRLDMQIKKKTNISLHPVELILRALSPSIIFQGYINRHTTRACSLKTLTQEYSNITMLGLHCVDVSSCTHKKWGVNRFYIGRTSSVIQSSKLHVLSYEHTHSMPNDVCGLVHNDHYLNWTMFYRWNKIMRGCL